MTASTPHIRGRDVSGGGCADVQTMRPSAGRHSVMGPAVRPAGAVRSLVAPAVATQP
jgi:hypothetical protein